LVAVSEEWKGLSFVSFIAFISMLFVYM
jgi:hypothetical protein